MKINKFIILLTAGIVIFILSACNTNDTPAASLENDEEAISETENDEASVHKSEWNLVIATTTLDGDTITSADLQDNTLTVMNVWATWCPPCVEELPHLQEMNELFKEENVQIVGVLQDGVTELGARDEATIESAQKLLTEVGAEYTVILPDETLITNFISNMQYFPTTYFLNSEGEVVKTVVGAKEAQDWEATINGVLEEIKK